MSAWAKCVCLSQIVYRVILLALVTSLVACGNSSNTPRVEIVGTGTDRIDSLMDSVLARYDPPGIAVALVRNDKLVFVGTYGHADLARTEPLRADHLFRIASVSKPVTGIGILRAHEDGLLDINNVAFPGAPSNGEDPRIALITIRQLLRHTDGWDLFDYPNDPLFRSLEISQDLGVPLPVQPRDVVEWMKRQPLAFDPDTNFAYTNASFVVLGELIEDRTGYSYEDFVTQFVLVPAGINDAHLSGITKDEKRQNEVEYESFENDIWKSVFDGITTVPEPAYGGLNLIAFAASSGWLFSVVDLARLAAATDGDPVYPDIISEQSFDLMTTSATPFGAPSMGAAWYLDVDGTGKALAWDHAGEMPGTVARIARLRSGVIVVVASNTARGQEYFDDITIGLVNAVNGISEWPDVDLFPSYD